MERHKQTLPMVHTSYIKIFTLFLGLVVSSLGHAKNTSTFSSFFHNNIQQLKTNLLKTQSFIMPEICDNGIDDDGDGLIDCFDPDCSASCITGNLSRSFTSSSTNYGFFSYDPDPSCASADWGDDWTKFQSPEWFYMDEYDDGSFIMRGTLVSLTDSNDSWEVWIRLHNKRSWTEWSALGRMFYEASAGGNCSANHTTWDFYETDETASRWFGTPGSANDGKVVNIGHSPADFSKGVQVGFGANNCETCSCSSFNVRGWYKMSGDLDLPCGDYGSVMSGFETMNECNVYNGDFEDGLDYWEARDGVSVTNDAASGNAAGVINADNGTLSQIYLPATPDYSYVANIWSKIAGAPSGSVLVMEFYDAFLNPLERYATEVTSIAYQEYTLGGVAPPNSVYVSIWGWKGNGGSFYLDEFCLEIGKNYTESNCQDIQNGGFEDGTMANWNTWGAVTATSSANAGSYAALIYGSDGGMDQTFNVTAGETYNFETYIRETNIDGNTSYGISWLDASGTGIYSFWQSLFTANYKKYQLLGRAPSNATQARIWVTKTGNGELYIDDNCFKVFERRPPTEICNNGVDDDNDGLIDGFDDDCCANLSIIPQANYSLHFVDSEQVGFGEAINAFDGDTDTYWHTNFNNTTYPLPHEIQIDLGSTHKIGGFRYLPVQLAPDGRIEDFEVYVSDNPNSWGMAVATGTLTYTDLGDKEISFPLTEGRYFRLVALSEVSNNGFTTALEINILECKGQEICNDGIDNNGDGRIDFDDADCDCPTITSMDYTNINVCADTNVTFTVYTDASNLDFDEIEFYSFSAAQSNPYTATGDDRKLIRKFDNDTGMASINSTDFVIDNGTNTTYYVYAVLSPLANPSTSCIPFLEFVLSVDLCQEIEINCMEGRTIETYSAGINNDVPKTLSFSELEDIDSIFVQIVYEDKSPGNSISVTDNDGNIFSFQRVIKDDIHLYQGIIPPTSNITYSNQSNNDKAQSIVAYVYKNNQSNGAFARYNVAVSGHSNTRNIDFPLPERANNQDVTIKLPISELTYDDRLLHFKVTAGTYTNTFTKQWGPSGDDFPGSCCLDFIEIVLPDLSATVDHIRLEIISPGNRMGQSYIVAGTVLLEINCDDTEVCPTIATTDDENINICANGDVTFTVVTDASNLPFDEIEFYSFTAAQTNPYSALGAGKKLIGKFNNDTGMGSIVSNNFPAINGMISTYYVYAVLSPPPSDLTDCIPFLEYIITAEPCQEICDNGIDDDGDGLVDCQDPDCDNPNNGGTIAGNESNCGLYTPTLIVEQIAPSGLGVSIPEYQWEKSLDNSTWMEIETAIQSTYLPTIITQTTYFRRKFKRNSCNPWIASNIVTKTVTPSTFDAEIINAPSGINGYLCNSESYVFQAAVVDDAIYNWDFGGYANPSNATGIGPHTVVFNTPSPNLPISTEIVLKVIGTSGALCVATDTIPINIRPLSNVVTIDYEDPSVCGASDGWITLTTSGEIGGCIEVSLDGGISYEPEGQVAFTNLSAGSYQIVTRYCDNECPNIAQIVNLSDPATINLLNDDFDKVCPGFNYTANVFINDDIKGDVVLSLASDGSFGTVVLADNGDFVYMPQNLTCDMDQFAYTVCDPGMNCCVTAVVTIDFNDDEAPILINVPDDLTINCDEEIPLPPLVTASDNCPAISIDKEETSTQGTEGCSLYDYSVTYKWIARDFCENIAIDSQQVFVKDQTAPDIYRIYTLPNGKKLVAGVMENVTHRWKVVQLPIEFNTRPLVFSQLTTTNEASAAIVRLRNISANQFEVKLQEEAANDNQRIGESVAWFAIEVGTQLSDYQLDAGLFSVGDAVRNINFQNGFSKTPAFFTNMQSILDADPGYPRNENLSNVGVSVNIQEEASMDSDVTHNQEKLAYLAIDTSILSTQEGDVLGEAGKLMIDNNWQTVQLSNDYTNPVVVANILGSNEVDPAIVQVDNVTAESFDIRIKEWDYLDGSHVAEVVSFIVIEGSLPLSGEKFCEYGTDSLVLGVDIVAVDNCDQNVSIVYEEVESFSGPRQIFSRIWSAVDECGNETRYSQEILCEGVYVQIKAILQGATIYNDDGLMRDDLRKKGLIPLTEPYSANPNFEHVGGGGNEVIEESMMNITGTDACVDWVFIELFDGNDISNVVATQSGLIQKDGDVMTTKGDTLIRFKNIPPGDYYIALSHRNHLKTISLYPYTFTPNAVPLVNFMDNFTPVIGIEPNIDLGSGQKALWSGDLNGDAQVIYQGPRNDVFDMFLHVILDSINSQFLTNFISSGYTNNDFNMDGTVIFQGPNNDKSTMLFNTTLRHPDNPENISNFVIATHAQAQILEGNNPDGTTPGFDFDMDGIQDGLDPDDDNDGVADGNDIDAKNKNSDSDGDGITDDMETGGDGHYDYLIDTDPLNPCSPEISSLCIGIDTDMDGFFRNYPMAHPKYDAHDENSCLPDFNNSNCSCSSNITDNGNEILVKICHKQGNGNFKTLEIPVSALPAYLGNGDICGPCNE